MNILIDDLNVNYEVFGPDDSNENAKSVLLLHGWGACIEAMAPIYMHLRSHFKVYVLDFPGESGKTPPASVPWGVPEYGEMTKKFIDALGIQNPHVIAHSFGGRVTIYLASKYRDLFDKIVLTDAAGVRPIKTFKKTFKSYMFKCGKWILQNLTPVDKRDELLKAYRDKHSSADYKAIKSEALRETFKKVINLDLTDNLKDITRPTLLVWGENDTDTPLYMGKVMENNIPDSGLVVLKDAGHFSYLDKTSQYNAIIDNFFSD